jgi:dihydrofolate reductase
MPDPEIVVAVARNGVIGVRGALPWRLPEDLRRFKALTLGHTVLMGRRTYESIGRLLPQRLSILVSRQVGWHVDGAITATSLDAALAQAPPERRLFVIGGGEIYTALLPRVDTVHLTEVYAAPDDGDAWFPPLDRSVWVEQDSESWPAQDEAPACRFVRLRRIDPLRATANVPPL